MNTNTFYDIHFHAMNLSHANITAFANRLLEDLSPELVKKIVKSVLPIWKKVLLPFVPRFFLSKIIHKVLIRLVRKEQASKTRNLLSFMESSIEFNFLIIEHFLKKDLTINERNQLVMGQQSFSKMVLCPLIMDFGYKSINNPDIFYNVPPQKPVTLQIKDLFSAINSYYTYDLDLIEEDRQIKFNIRKSETPLEKKFFEIYPFMGINTQNYTLEDIRKMMDKYFADFSSEDSPDERRKKLYDKMGRFKGNLDDEADCKNIFAGIKVYPPLGFQPWPVDENENKKVQFLYQVCSEKRVPITTHCSTGGFEAADESQSYSDPRNQWSRVLDQYADLKLNYAHFGSGDDEWKQAIISQLLTGGSQVYTDFSCNTEKDNYYRDLNVTIQKHPDRLSDRILFGSDFMINLLWYESYNEYLKTFIQTTHLSQELKMKFVNQNPERFLFG
jgi:hypothetical protein